MHSAFARGTESRYFWPVLGAVTLLGLGARLVYALAVAPDEIQPGDSFVYHTLAQALADGNGYSTVASLLKGHPMPTAEHPPLFSLYLAAWTKLGLGSLTAHRAEAALLGAATVFVIGLLGRRVAGPRAGLIAAGIAALYPQLVMADGTLIAESLYAPLIALSLLLAYRLIDRPTEGWAAALGAAIGLATLTRPEAIVLVVLLAAPVAWRAGAHRLRLLAVGVAASVVVLTPWLVRNWIQLDRFPLISTNGALTSLAANCPQTYYDSRYVGFVYHNCALHSKCIRLTDEIALSDCIEDEAVDYVRAHKGRVPVVVMARVGRLWNVYGPRTDLYYGKIWGRNHTLGKVGLAVYAALVPLGLAGVALLRRRGPLLPLLVPFALATIVAASAFGFSRYRLAAEIPLVVLAAVTLDALASTASRRYRARTAARADVSS
jgi:4-amino-4-deoxy-L-arabinose transferase-like glycosyltransferase